jgi:hypothetical protein
VEDIVVLSVVGRLGHEGLYGPVIVVMTNPSDNQQ